MESMWCNKGAARDQLIDMTYVDTRATAAAAPGVLGLPLAMSTRRTVSRTISARTLSCRPPAPCECRATGNRCLVRSTSHYTVVARTWLMCFLGIQTVAPRMRRQWTTISMGKRAGVRRATRLFRWACRLIYRCVLDALRTGVLVNSNGAQRMLRSVSACSEQPYAQFHEYIKFKKYYNSNAKRLHYRLSPESTTRSCLF